VEQRAQDMLHTAVIGVELAAFDDPGPASPPWRN
jgi:hypothetical protein